MFKQLSRNNHSAKKEELKLLKSIKVILVKQHPPPIKLKSFNWDKSELSFLFTRNLYTRKNDSSTFNLHVIQNIVLLPYSGKLPEFTDTLKKKVKFARHLCAKHYLLPTTRLAQILYFNYSLSHHEKHDICHFYCQTENSESCSYEPFLTQANSF